MSPYLIQWGPHAGLRYYSLAYIAGIFFSAWLGVRFYRWGWSAMSPERMAWFMPWCVFAVVVSGHLGDSLFYQWREVCRDPFSIVRPSGGGFFGMASHGVILGLPVFFWIYCRVTRFPFWNLMDNVFTVMPVTIGLVRLGNFMNGESWGRPSSLPWAVIFPGAGDGVPRHPFQIHGFLGEGVLMFVLMWLFRRRHPPDGSATVFFLAVYSGVRFFLEFFRAPDDGLFFGWLTRGQLLCAGCLGLAVVVALWQRRRKHFAASNLETR
ncbi:MAG: prolipoprotein diacylglyceryl transferase [Verrucomicrobiae bacterium]|nr:prolipoprotein diacylglyceryl transferase [Verrucomicrobiae bacterium]